VHAVHVRQLEKHDVLDAADCLQANDPTDDEDHRHIEADDAADHTIIQSHANTLLQMTSTDPQHTSAYSRVSLPPLQCLTHWCTGSGSLFVNVSVFANRTQLRRGCLCVCVCRIDVLCPNDWVDNHATSTRLQPSHSSFPMTRSNWTTKLNWINVDCHVFMDHHVIGSVTSCHVDMNTA